MKIKRGFALMDKKRLLEVCSKGGKRVQELGRGHRLTSEEARKAQAKRKNLYHDEYSNLLISANEKFRLRHPERYREIQRKFYLKRKKQIKVRAAKNYLKSKQKMLDK